MNINISKKSKYNESDASLLIKGDCFRVLKRIPEKTVDLVFADPPYFLSSGGISCKSGKQVSVNKGEWDKSLDIKNRLNYHRKWIKLCKNVLKDNGSIMISATLHSVYAIGVALEMEGFSIINNIIWRKTNPAPNLACRCFTHSTETVIWARKQLTQKKKGKHTFNYSAMKEENGGKQMKDVWEFEELEPEILNIATTPKSEKKFGKHPTQKPIALMNRLINASTNPGDIVLDPFSGSGTTGVSCLLNKRQFIGVEQDINYLELSKNRLESVEVK